MKRAALILVGCVFAPSVWAGGKASPPSPTTDVEQAQHQQQSQGQHQGQAQASSSSADASSSSASSSRSQASGGMGIGGAGGAGGNSGGNTLSTAYESRDRSLAVALPGQTGAPAVAGECLEHTRGGSGLSIGVSGRTRINRECMEFVQCVALADRYAAWGQLQLAVEQLERCGGVPAREIETPTLASDQQYVTREELERAFRAATVK